MILRQGVSGSDDRRACEGKHQMRPHVSQNALAAILILVTGTYALAENITLTTYYPSPRGVYLGLRTTGRTVLAVGGGSVGIGTAAPAAKLDVSGNVRVIDLTCADCLGSKDLASNSVGTVEILNNAVDARTIANDAVTTAKIVNNAVTGAKIATDAVGPSELVDRNVTPGTYGDGVTIPEITVHRDGIITTITPLPIAAVPPPIGSTSRLHQGAGVILSPDPWDPSSGIDASIDLASAAGGGVLDCVTIQEQSGGKTATCPGGYTVTGCGTFGSGKDDQVQNGQTQCFNDEKNVWARCCRIN